MPTKALRPTLQSRIDQRKPLCLTQILRAPQIGFLVWLAFLTACTGSPSKGDKQAQSRPETLPDVNENSEVAGQWSFSLEDQAASATNNRTDKPSQSLIRLTDVHADAGIEHTYQNGARGAALISETIGGGCGWLDFDLDGRIDLYLNQAGIATAPGDSPQPIDRLWQNLVVPPKPLRFRDSTMSARISETGYSQGVAIADFDNDGFDDIYVTNLGANTLWRNMGDGTFLDVSSASGTNDRRWGTSAAWGDLDRDGDLDLYVCNYCDFDPANPAKCLDREGRPTVCNPAELAPQSDAVFVNEGNGIFRESAAELGLRGDGNRALGVAIADFTNDGWADIYVANDTTENFLFVNDGNGSFQDEATLRGCAVDRAGGPQGSMGVGVADVDQNGFLDIYCTHFFEESNTLYTNFGDLGFRDKTAIAGLHGPTLDYLAFGTDFVDLNNDGQLELFVANGHVDHSARAADPNMPAQLFQQSGNQRWADISTNSGDYFSRKMMGRGVAHADVDSDGDLDLAVANENSPANLLLNESQYESFLRVQLVGVSSNRSAIGSRVSVEISTGSGDESERIAEIVGGASFASSHERTVHFGIGSRVKPIKVSILWPSGTQQALQLEPNQTHTITEPKPSQ